MGNKSYFSQDVGISAPCPPPLGINTLGVVGNDSVCSCIKCAKRWNDEPQQYYKSFPKLIVSCFINELKCMANGLIPLNVPNSIPRARTHTHTHTHTLLETIGKLFLRLQVTPPSPAPSHSASHLLCAVRGQNNWRHGPSVCVRVGVCTTGHASFWANVCVCVLTCARPWENASVLVAQGTASAQFNSPLNATVTPVRLCVATYLRRRRYGKNLWTSKSRRLHGSSQL